MYLSSSIWSSFCILFNNIFAKSIWLVGESSSLSFWHRIWLIPTVAEHLWMMVHTVGSVRDFRENGEWKIPWHLRLTYNTLANYIEKVRVLSYSSDQLFWVSSTDGKASPMLSMIQFSLGIDRKIRRDLFGLCSSHPHDLSHVGKQFTVCCRLNWLYNIAGLAWLHCVGYVASLMNLLNICFWIADLLKQCERLFGASLATDSQLVVSWMSCLNWWALRVYWRTALVTIVWKIWHSKNRTIF